MMHIGIQLLAPDGYKGLSLGIIYYFVMPMPRTGHIRLAFYSELGSGYKVNLIKVHETDLEDGLLKGKIIVRENPQRLPPSHVGFGEEVHDVDPGWIADAKTNHRDLLNDRMELIKPLLDMATEIIASDDPREYLRNYVKSCQPAQNIQRIEEWFYSYILHNMNIDVLLPRFHKNGKYDRTILAERGIKLGRKSIRHGGSSGHPCTQKLKHEIGESFDKCADTGDTWDKIYSKAINRYFGCKTATHPLDKAKMIVHPEGLPFPSLPQYKYQLIKLKGQKGIDTKKYGAKRQKEEKTGDAGQFSESVGTLMERVEFDGYYVAEKPKGMAGVYLTRLCVVTAICVTSGMLVGIGFSIDSESSEAYEMCLWSMAMDKVHFCRLFGIEIDAHEWPSKGMAGMEVYDRGPAFKIIATRANGEIPIIELTPTYSGQSKATIESSHPKEFQSKEAPHYKTSNLSYLEMAVRAIHLLIEHNKSANVGSRMTPEMIGLRVNTNPLAIWNYHASRGRTMAMPMAYEDSVRRFLVKKDIKITRGAAYLLSLRYDAPDFRETGIYDKVAQGQEVDVKCFVMQICIRHIWVEYKGRLYQLDAQLPIQDADEQLFMSLSDLQSLEKTRSYLNSIHRENAPAVQVDVQARLESQIGKSSNGGTIKRGRFKKSKEAIQQIVEIKKMGRK